MLQASDSRPRRWQDHAYTGRQLRISRAIRASAWALVALGVSAPALRRRVKLPPGAVMVSAALAPPALAVAMAPSRRREVAICLVNMWAYLAAYEIPHDDAQRQAKRVRIDYPIVADRVLGLGVPPTVRLQRGLSTPDTINRFERLLVFCHWIWFAVPHGSLIYV